MRALVTGAGARLGSGAARDRCLARSPAAQSRSTAGGRFPIASTIASSASAGVANNVSDSRRAPSSRSHFRCAAARTIMSGIGGALTGFGKQLDLAARYRDQQPAVGEIHDGEPSGRAHR